MGRKYTCKICGKIVGQLGQHIIKEHNMTHKEYYDKYLKKDPSEGICPVCGKETFFLGLNYGYRHHCCVSCSTKDPNVQKKLKQTRKEKYGDENYSLFGSKSWKDNLIKKYGRDDLGQFGTDHQILALQKKYPEANILDTDNSNQAMLKINKLARPYASMVEKHIADFLTSNNIEFKYNYKSKDYPYKCDFYVLNTYIEIHAGPWHSGKIYTGSKEDKKQIEEWNAQGLNTWSEEWKYDSIKKKALDKVNGLIFWTEQEFFHWINLKLGKPYFQSQEIISWLNKYNIKYEIKNDDFYLLDYNQVIRIGKETNEKEVQDLWQQGYNVIVIFPWQDTKQILNYLEYSLKLKPTIRYYARKLDLVEQPIDRKIRKFIQDNHILGSVAHNNPKCALCFYDNDDLIGVGTFISKSKYYELKRLIYKKGISIVGGTSKIIKEFSKKYNDKPLITYSDNDISKGEVYLKCGMTLSPNISKQTNYYSPYFNKKVSHTSIWQIGADRICEKLVDIQTKKPVYVKAGIDKDCPVGNIELLTQPCRKIANCGFDNQKYCFLKYEDAGNRLFTLKPN